MVDADAISPNPDSEPASRSESLSKDILRRGPQEAAIILSRESEDTIATVLTLLPTAKAVALLPRFEAALRAAVLKAVTPEQRQQWLQNEQYPKGSVGRLMEPVVATFQPTVTVYEAIEALRHMVKEAFITYGYVVDDRRRLIGVLVMRELLLAMPSQLVQEVMIEYPFSLKAMQSVAEVLPLIHTRHFPEYPVCDDGDRIIGIVRGYALFQEQTLELSAQPGRMVGIDREERIQTDAWRSLHLRNPWLQVNLLSSFLAAGVVGFYEETVVQVIAVAAFVPVMVGQSASTGAQALAVALRGLTLGDFRHENWQTLMNKEALVGVANGALVGLTAALAMYVYATLHDHAGAGLLALVMFLAMIVSTLVSSVVGAAMPILMKSLGFDPANASTILVGGVTRIVSIAAFLALAHWMLL
jgi:magnesium transporter